MFTFDSACEHLKLGEKEIESIRSSYGGKNRIYHGMHHIEEMLKHAPVGEEVFTDSLLLAILYHDIVYHPFSPKGVNEVHSCLRLKESGYFDWDGSLGNLGKFAFIDAINAIVATTYHAECQGESLSIVASWLCDLDLCIFAYPWEEFLKWDSLVAEEYALGGVPDEAWKINRPLFLKKMLKRRKIYYVTTKWESKARENLERIVNDLDRWVY